MCGTFVGTFKYMSPERIRNQPYGYASDIWSLGLVIMECATGMYPIHEHGTCIEMAQVRDLSYIRDDEFVFYNNLFGGFNQAILDCEIPSLPSDRFSPELSEFIALCLHRDADKRLPAEILLGAPWLLKHGAVSFEASVGIVRDWIHRLTHK
jgi:mitogen-activated protein kinase kinase 1